MHTETATTLSVADALYELGTLTRNADGVEVWTIRDRSGAIVADGIESDFDAAFVAASVAAVAS